MTNIQFQQDEQRWSSLMAAAQGGNERDYETLLSELCAFIEGYLRSRIGHHQSIDDWVQDILIAIHQGRHTYNPQRPIRPWLFAIIRHQTIDGMRRQKSYRKMLESQTQDHTCAEDQIQAAEDASLLEGCLFKALKPQHREALTLTKIIGLSCKEAAVQLGVTEVTLKVRVHRAIKQLKKLLEAEPYE
ncbi:MAG: sigma-70 family RNA polymerase sigma factor [Porticoccaceae bacterium]|nr:sigma-70 family RNA polymerase sigma factor [Porticoccaceae bacterium]